MFFQLVGETLIQTLHTVSNFRRLPFALYIIALGLISGLAMPPVDAWFVLGLTFPLLVWLLERRQNLTVRQTYGYGWLFGFGYFTAVLHWIGFAFLVDAADYLWMMPFAVGALAGGMALFWSAAIGTAFVLARKHWPLFLVLPLCFALAEWLRGHIFTGFPWAVPGLAVDGMGPVAQLASVIGMNGLTLMVVLWAMVPIGLASQIRAEKNIAAVFLLALPLSWAWGQWRIATVPHDFIANVVVRLVQPNISQDDKWRGNNAREIFQQLLDLSSRPAAGGAPTIIVWPESAVPFLIDESEVGRRELLPILTGQKILLTGAVRRSSTETIAGKSPDYFTSILAFDSHGQVMGRYDKKHLVPGGEYLPLAWLLEPLGFRKVVNVPESFSEGTTSAVLTLAGAGNVAMQICYEAIFPESLQNVGARPDWVLNVTNDGWFGNSAGPYQHLAQLRLRAIEQGFGIVRVANTGVSAIIDSTGSYVMVSTLGAVVVADSAIPKALQSTPFSIWGYDWLFLMSLGMFLVAGILRNLRISKVVSI
jgi:apolipoprotein N-acyltransferase